MDRQPQPPNLEDALRQMILSNVRIDHGQEQRAPHSNFRGNRNGRGNYPAQGAHNGAGESQVPNPAHGQHHIGQQPRGRGTFRQANNRPYHGQHFNQAQHIQRDDHQFQPSGPRGRGNQNYVALQGSPRAYNHGGPPNAPPANASRYHYDSNVRNQPPQGAKLWSSPNAHAEHTRSNVSQINQYPVHATPDSSRFRPDQRWKYLDDIANRVLPEIGITPDELELKNNFRQRLEAAFQAVQAEGETIAHNSLSIQAFGSLRSGFATKGSDMDLVIVDDMGSEGSAHMSMREDGLARRLEKYLLELGIGARLLTRARVPIIKVCESPPPDLLQALRDARAKWDDLPDDEKYDESGNRKAPENKDQTKDDVSSMGHSNDHPVLEPTLAVAKTDLTDIPPPTNLNDGVEVSLPGNRSQPEAGATPNSKNVQKRWLREKKQGPLDFPKDGVGIQSDINFFNPLGLHNTQMLYCYSLCDRRVQPMIMFIKAWAKKRRINSPYSGTLSSYGYVLMVLHYLVNVARPPVLPNLQLEAHKMNLPMKTVEGWEVNFWSDDAAIRQAAMMDRLSRNNEPLGALLTGFFQYYATSLSGWGFIWMKDVLSLRTLGGILTKEEKGWTGAKTETVDTKEIRHRYLFAVEDPFELTHNVARTVTHNGVVAIRDEFRRAWRILGAVWKDREPADGNLMDELVEHNADDA